MAKKDKSVAVTGVQIPDGYEDHSKRDVDGWLKPAVGVVASGTLVGDFTREDDDGKMQTTVLIEVDRDTPAFVTKDEETTLLPGQVLGVTLSGGIKDLIDYVDSRTKVFLVWEEKVAIRGGRQSMWKIKKLLQKGAVRRPRGNVATSSVDDRNIPF